MLKINEPIIDALDLMPNDIKAVFYPAIFDYLRKDKEPDFTETNLAFWILIKSLLKKKSPKTDTANYDAIIADSATMTQAQLAAKYGKSQSTINRILKNKKSTPVESEKQPVESTETTPVESVVLQNPSPTPPENDDWEPNWEPDIEDDVATYLERQEELEERAAIEFDEQKAYEECFGDLLKPHSENPHVEKKEPESVTEAVTAEENPQTENPQTEKPSVEPVKLSETETAAENLFLHWYNVYSDARNRHPNLKLFDMGLKSAFVPWMKKIIETVGIKNIANIERLITEASFSEPVIKLGFTLADLKTYYQKHKNEVLEYEIY